MLVEASVRSVMNRLHGTNGRRAAAGCFRTASARSMSGPGAHGTAQRHRRHSRVAEPLDGIAGVRYRLGRWDPTGGHGGRRVPAGIAGVAVGLVYGDRRVELNPGAQQRWRRIASGAGVVVKVAADRSEPRNATYVARVGAVDCIPATVAGVRKLAASRGEDARMAETGSQGDAPAPPPAAAQPPSGGRGGLETVKTILSRRPRLQSASIVLPYVRVAGPRVTGWLLRSTRSAAARSRAPTPPTSVCTRPMRIKAEWRDRIQSLCTLARNALGPPRVRTPCIA